MIVSTGRERKGDGCFVTMFLFYLGLVSSGRAVSPLLAKSFCHSHTISKAWSEGYPDAPTCRLLDISTLRHSGIRCESTTPPCSTRVLHPIRLIWFRCNINHDSTKHLRSRTTLLNTSSQTSFSSPISAPRAIFPPLLHRISFFLPLEPLFLLFPLPRTPLIDLHIHLLH